MKTDKLSNAKDKASFEILGDGREPDHIIGQKACPEGVHLPPGRVSFVEPLTKTVLSAEEVCSILRECKGAGVSVLKFGDLDVEFDPVRSSRIDPRRSRERNSNQAKRPTQKNSPAEMGEAEKVELDARERDAMRDEQIDLDELHITNPLEYERRLNAGELEDERGSEEA